MPRSRVISSGAYTVRPILLCLLTVLAAHTLRSQKLPVRLFSSADGMASSVIHHVARDSRGFLWFAARGGLSRYDGSQFVNYRIAPDLASPIVNFFLETRDGTFWIATDAGLYRVKPEEPVDPIPIEGRGASGERDLNASKVSNSGFWSLHEDPAGRLWGGLTKLYLIEDRNADTVSVVPVEFADPSITGANAEIRSFADSSDGSLWIGFSDGVARRLTDGRFVFYRLPRVTRIQQTVSVRLDAGGRVWVSSTTGMFVFRPAQFDELGSVPDRTVIEQRVDEIRLQSWGTINLPDTPGTMLRLTIDDPSPSVAAQMFDDLYPEADGRVWLPSRKGLYVFSGNDYRRLLDPSTELGIARRIEKDLGGRLWFGSFVGVLRYSPTGLVTYGHSSGLVEPAVHLIQTASNGDPLVVHGNWRVSRLTTDGFTSDRLDVPESAIYSWTSHPVFADSRGNLWALTLEGLFRTSIGGASQLVAPPEFGRSNRGFYRAFEQKNGVLWFGIRSSDTGLFRYDPRDESWIDASILPGYPKNRAPASFAEAPDGSLWFGFYSSGGVFKFTGNSFEEFSTPDSTRSNSIFALEFDREGRLWVGSSGGGVLRIDRPQNGDPSNVVYTEADGLSSNNVRCLTEGADGSIYAGTIRGVSRIEPSTSAISTITTSDGLAADFVHAAYTAPDGSIWFGTSNGLSKLVPVPESTEPQATVYISDLTVAGTEYRLSPFGQRNVGGLDLPAGQNNIQISFFGVGAAPAVNYVYRLEGSLNDSWSEPISYRTLNFANLSPGNYKLYIGSLSGTDNVPSDPAVVTFTIEPPFYRTWWFIALAFLLTAGSIIALDRYRAGKTHQVERALVRSLESESRFRTLTDTASDAILTIDEDSQIVFANESVEKVFGYRPDEVIGQRLTMLMPERMRDGHENGFGRYLSSGTRSMSWEGVALPGLNKSGEEIPLEVSFGEFERDGKRYFTGIARDISERKRAEAALQRSREERFAELQRVRSRIATDLHDDIGSSLTQISVYSELARQRERDNGDARESLDMITNISNELVDTMSDIVWAINPKKDHLPDLTQRMRRYAANALSAKQIEMTFSAPDTELEIPLGANVRREVFLIFKETVNNIVKHSEAKNVAIEFGVDDDLLNLRFADDGIGFDESLRVIEGEPDWKRFRGGNGLLNMRRRAEELGGRYEVDSKIGKGTNVRLEIPLEAAEQPAVST